MKRYLGLLSVVAVVGCGQPATQPPVPSTAGAAPEAASVGTQPARYETTGAPEADGVIVRYKTGKAPVDLGRGVFDHTLGLERAHLIRTRDAAEANALVADLRRDPAVEFAEPNYKLHAFQTANDPYVSKQWAVPKIQLPEAWDVAQGGPLVAVVDTGVAYNHPDLAGQIVKGYDFINNDSDPMDDQGHGTHVAGVIAALTNNGAGVAGTAPATKVLAVKALAADGSGTTSSVSDSILYAVNQGAKVISLSLGGPHDSMLLRETVEKAIAAGVTVVAAAGNDGTSTRNYPAAYPGVLSVGATNSSDTRAHFSNYGDWVNVAAPGDTILSTVPSGYAYASGTSMAAPYVSGVAALVRSKNPGWSESQISQTILATGDAVTGFEANAAVRRLNALKALGGATVSPTPTPTASPTPTPTPSPTPKPKRGRWWR